MAETKITKILPSQTLGMDPETGIVDAYVSIMGIKDDDMPPDVIELGAFTKTINERGPNGVNRIKVLWQHNWQEVIGLPLVLQEHPRVQLPYQLLDKFPEASGGLFTRTQLVMDVQRGREAHALMKAGAMNEWSIGFDVVQGAAETVEGEDYRRIKEVRLWEYSPVTWGANPATVTTNVKHSDAQDILKLEPEQIRLLAEVLGLDPETSLLELLEKAEERLKGQGPPEEAPGDDGRAHLERRLRQLQINYFERGGK